jgi:sugar-specific transcriptional regulator TrmB
MSDYVILKSLGLSQLEIICYESLFNEGATTANELAERLGKQSTGIYHQLRRLQAKGFITAVKSYDEPAWFHANTVEQALRALAQYQRQLAAGLIELQYQRWPARRPKQL